MPQLRQLLYRTSLEHVIKYIPGDRCSVVYLHHDRLRPGNIDLQKEKYAFLLENARARVEAMVDYASEGDECRSRWLLRYFGQEESSDCGGCDVCRARRLGLPPGLPSEQAALRRRILNSGDLPAE